MKLKKLLILSLLLIPCLFIGCAKKDKLTNNTMVLSIEPQVIGTTHPPDMRIIMKVGEWQSLYAVIRNSKLEEIDEPVTWSVSPVIGTFSSQNKNTRFLATDQGNAQITLTCQGMSASVNFTVEL